jgi:hypothetical protein
MRGDSLCGYYTILSQLFPDKYGGNILGPYNNNVEIRIAAKMML